MGEPRPSPHTVTVGLIWGIPLECASQAALGQECSSQAALDHRDAVMTMKFYLELHLPGPPAVRSLTGWLLSFRAEIPMCSSSQRQTHLKTLVPFCSPLLCGATGEDTNHWLLQIVEASREQTKKQKQLNELID